MAAVKETSMAHLIRAFFNSMQGLKAAWLFEKAFRLEIYLALLFLPLGAWLADTVVQVYLLFMAGILVLIIEIINSAIEATIDRIGPELHELSGRAKDLASAAAFLAQMQFLAVFFWLLWNNKEAWL